MTRSISKNRYNIDAKSKVEQIIEQRKKYDANISPKKINNRCTNPLRNRCETCDPKIQKNMSLGAPRGRRSDIEYSETPSFWAAGVPRAD